MSMRTADYIAKFLAEKGVKHVFTVTGGGAMHLNNAFGKNKDLTCIYFHHEQACAIAAEGYARLTGKPVAVCVTSGPGGTNALTGVLGAYLDSIPVFVVSGQVKYSTTVKATGLPLRQFGDQEYPIVKSAKRMTKYAKMITDAADIKKMMQKAWRKMLQGRKGPVWLDVPLNIQGEKIDVDKLVGEEKWPKVYPAQDADIDALVEKLRTAERPIILAGTGIRLAGAHAEFLKLVAHLGIPVTTAWNAHDVIPDTHPLYAGRPGTIGDRAGNFALYKSDLMLVLGCRMNIRQISYNYEAFAPNTYKAVVDIDATELKKPSVKIDLPIHADLSSVMDKLLTREMMPRRDISDWISWCQQTRARYPIPTKAQIEDENGVNVYHFMGTLYDRLPDDANVIASNGSACVCGFQAAKIKEKTRLFTNSGCASMGYGLPAAIGAALSAHEGPVICLEGDGSLQMNIQELQTVKHY
ncbi:MAG: thiamine pyrophosphate-binding protein, partial [Eubacteriales bacterium]